MEVVARLDDVPGKFQHGLTGTTGRATDPRHAVSTVGSRHGRFGGHGIVAAQAHLPFPVVTLGHGDEIGIGILALGDRGLHLLAGFRGKLQGLFGLEQGVLEQIVEPRVGTLED